MAHGLDDVPAVDWLECEHVVDLLECEHVVDVLLSVLNSAILWRSARSSSRQILCQQPREDRRGSL